MTPTQDPKNPQEDVEMAKAKVLLVWPDAQWSDGRQGLYSPKRFRQLGSGDLDEALFSNETAAWLSAAQNLQPSTLPPETEAARPDSSNHEAVVRAAVPTLRIEPSDFGFEVIGDGLIAGGHTLENAFREFRKHSPAVIAYESAKRPPITKLVEDSGPRIDTSPFPPVEHPDSGIRHGHCPACLQGQDSSAGEGTHLEGTLEHPERVDRPRFWKRPEGSIQPQIDSENEPQVIGPRVDSSEGACVACEGTPTFPNLPCAVCGKPSPTEGDAGGEQLQAPEPHTYIPSKRFAKNCDVCQGARSRSWHIAKPTPAPETVQWTRGGILSPVHSALQPSLEDTQTYGSPCCNSLQGHHPSCPAAPTPQAVAGVELPPLTFDEAAVRSKFEYPDGIYASLQVERVRLQERDCQLLAALRDLQEARVRIEAGEKGRTRLMDRWQECINGWTEARSILDKWRLRAELAESRLSALLSSVNNYRGMPPLTGDMEETGFVFKDGRFEVALTEKEPAEVTV